jgi:xanthosine utilization system XapX-like protein
VVPLILAVGLVNFLFGSMINRLPVVVSFVTLYGLMIGEQGVLSVWAVLGPQPLWRRWFASLLTLAGLAIALIGMLPTASTAERSLRAMFALPLIFAVPQLPLWLLRLTLGWRVVRSGVGEVAGAKDARQFGIQHLLRTTAAVALVLGLARLSVSDSPAGMMPTMWTSLLSTCLVLAVVNTFLLPACVWTGLRARELPTAIAGLAGYGLLLFLLIAVVVAFLSQGSASSDAGAWILLFLAISLGLIFGVLRWAHACGYVLVTAWPKERPTKVQDGTEADDSSEKATDEPPSQDTADSPTP